MISVSIVGASGYSGGETLRLLLGHPQVKVSQGTSDSNPEFLRQAVYGIPELHREAIRNAQLVTGAGCLATTAILGLYPLFKNGIADAQNVFIEGKVGSSAAGNKPSLASHHPERSGSL